MINKIITHGVRLASIPTVAGIGLILGGSTLDSNEVIRTGAGMAFIGFAALLSLVTAFMVVNWNGLFGELLEEEINHPLVTIMINQKACICTNPSHDHGKSARMSVSSRRTVLGTSALVVNAEFQWNSACDWSTAKHECQTRIDAPGIAPTQRHQAVALLGTVVDSCDNPSSRHPHNAVCVLGTWAVGISLRDVMEVPQEIRRIRESRPAD